MTSWRFGAVALATACATLATAHAECGDATGDRPVYLAFDAAGVAAAAQVAEVLTRQHVEATFFVDAGASLTDDSATWWSARAAEGHAFGALVKTTSPARVCAESTATAERFRSTSGRSMPKLFRLAVGKPPAAALAAAAAACDWTPVSAAMSLRNVHAGDVLVVPLGDTPRRDARTIARLEPLISGLKARGLCFATLREHPSYRSQFAW